MYIHMCINTRSMCMYVCMREDGMDSKSCERYYMYIHTCINYIYVHTYVHKYTKYVYVCLYARRWNGFEESRKVLYVHPYVYKYMKVCKASMCVYVSMYVCVYECMYV
jgi:hypothetical protein